MQKSNEALTDVINDVRNICFNLMPKTLEEFGLIKGLKEFCNHFLYRQKVNFVIDQSCELPDLTPELKIDLYRVIQEFINNALRHGKAKSIKMSFNYHKKVLKIILLDNGIGFNINETRKGMGLQNVHSRVKSHNGEVAIVSGINKGTQFKITIPINN